MKHLKKHLQTSYNIHFLFPFMDYAVAVCLGKNQKHPVFNKF